MHSGGQSEVLGGVGEEAVVFRALATLLPHPAAAKPPYLASGSHQQEHISLSKIVSDYAIFACGCGEI